MVWDIPGVSRGQLSQLCPLPTPCAPQPLAGGVGGEAGKALALCKPCSAVTKASLGYQHCFQHKSKTQPHTSSCEENYLYPSQNQHSWKLWQDSGDFYVCCAHAEYEKPGAIKREW